MVRPALPNQAPSEDDSTEPLPLSDLPVRSSGKRPMRPGKQTETRRHDDDSETLSMQTRLRLHSEDPVERATVLRELALTGGSGSHRLITQAFHGTASRRPPHSAL